MLKAGLVRDIADVATKIIATEHVCNAMRKILEEASYIYKKPKNYIYYEIETLDISVISNFRATMIEYGYRLEESRDEEYQTICFTIKW